jgi:predicted nucleotidyltransferase
MHGTGKNAYEKKSYTVSADKKKTRETLVKTLSPDERISFAYLFGSFTEGNIPFDDIDPGVFFTVNNMPEMSVNALALAVDFLELWN